MTGRRQLDAWTRSVDPDDVMPGRFVFTGGRKTMCVLCHATGYGPIQALVNEPEHYAPGHHLYLRAKWFAQRWSPWQVRCSMPHNWPCSCGRSFVQYGSLWKHIGGPRPAGWGRQGEHHEALTCAWPRDAHP